jgi:hypothetical protein
LIPHIAGNDIGLSKIGQLRAYVEEIIRWMGKIMPNTTINWSQILLKDNQFILCKQDTRRFGYSQVRSRSTLKGTDPFAFEK